MINSAGREIRPNGRLATLDGRYSRDLIALITAASREKESGRSSL
jgi:hypothetical protein